MLEVRKRSHRQSSPPTVVQGVHLLAPRLPQKPLQRPREHAALPPAPRTACAHQHLGGGWRDSPRQPNISSSNPAEAPSGARILTAPLAHCHHVCHHVVGSCLAPHGACGCCCALARAGRSAMPFFCIHGTTSTRDTPRPPRRACLLDPPRRPCVLAVGRWCSSTHRHQSTPPHRCPRRGCASTRRSAGAVLYGPPGALTTPPNSNACLRL